MNVLVVIVCALVVAIGPFMSVYASSDDEVLSQWTSDDGSSPDCDEEDLTSPGA